MKDMKRKGFALAIVFLLFLQLSSSWPGGTLAEGTGMIFEASAPNTGHYYTVEFVDYDGQLIAKQFVREGSAAIVPESPTRVDGGDIGYSFSGWQSSPEGILPENITGDVRFIAAYQAREKTSWIIAYRLAEDDPDIVIPPPLVFDFLVGDEVDISVFSPVIEGYQPDMEKVVFSEKIAANMPPVVVTYAKVAALADDMVDDDLQGAASTEPGENQYAYQIRYLLETSEELAPGFDQPEIQWTDAKQIVVWAKHDESGVLQPVTDYLIKNLSPDQLTYIDFFYQEPQAVSYAERVYLVGSKNHHEIVFQETRSGRVGETVHFQYDKTAYTDPNGVTYVYSDGDLKTVNSAVIQSDEDIIALRRYFYQTYTVEFVSSNVAYGMLLGQERYDNVRHGTGLNELEKPLPVPKEGCYFAGWRCALSAMGITEDTVFLAEFLPKEPLLIQAVSAETLYTGQLQTLAGEFVVTVNGELVPELAVSGITVSGASGQNVGVYPNTIHNKRDIVITNTSGVDVTEQYWPLFEDGGLTIHHSL